MVQIKKFQCEGSVRMQPIAIVKYLICMRHFRVPEVSSSAELVRDLKVGNIPKNWLVQSFKNT